MNCFVLRERAPQRQDIDMCESIENSNAIYTPRRSPPNRAREEQEGGKETSSLYEKLVMAARNRLTGPTLIEYRAHMFGVEPVSPSACDRLSAQRLLHQRDAFLEAYGYSVLVRSSVRPSAPRYGFARSHGDVDLCSSGRRCISKSFVVPRLKV